MAGNRKDETARVFSARVLGDSKSFERDYRAAVLKIIRASGDWYDLKEDQILSCFHIIRYPEIIEFRGPVKMIFNDGSIIDFSPLRGGASINSSALEDISSIETDAKSLMSIENKANYYHRISRAEEDELVIFHGGFHSPAKAAFLSMLKDGLSSETRLFHWGDIDLGGIRIFLSVKDILPSLQPYMMDRETLLANLDKSIPIEDGKRLEDIKAALADSRNEAFFPLLETMIETRSWLEQESLIS